MAAGVEIGAERLSLDGRLARSERTRGTVAAAFLDLINAGDLRPTAERVAHRAGFSLRLVFHHFSDLETLFAAAADLQAARLRPLVRPVARDLPFERRLAQFLKLRTRLLEAISPVRRAALLAEPFSAVIARRLAAERRRAHAEAEATFHPELKARPARERPRLLAALQAGSSWPLWETLRRHQDLSIDESRAVIELTLRALFQGRASDPHRRAVRRNQTARTSADGGKTI